MDDVVLAETNQINSQRLLDSTDHTSKKYHVEFGMQKTKFLRTGKQKDKIELKIGGKNIEETDKYTYLGEVNNKAMNLKDQIKDIERKYYYQCIALHYSVDCLVLTSWYISIMMVL